MSYINDIVIPGTKGRVFITGLDKQEDLQALKDALKDISGVENVDVNVDVFPTEITVVADTVVEVQEIEDVANGLGFHLIPKSNY